MAEKVSEARSGGARMAARGLKAVQVWFTPAELAEIRAAASAEGRPMSQFLKSQGLRAAKEFSKKS